ncbi:hypothetical protein FEM48_Zijuj08G0171500 [Ziziphus jujuba var. spinosa]|uniref:Uncharacterized protein n=1 Tax=Ziziphus jujuba var. spinosa TaxID=714518 RepID=A0A978V0C0_ZIZJJ|nr:hypothetical protein FEM48_Zijuj08G0171500 [Ziziphus jujuba var. spinosa]
MKYMAIVVLVIIVVMSAAMGTIWISTVYGEDVIEYLQHGRITTNNSVKAEMRFGFGNWKSNSRPIGICCQPAVLMPDNNFQATYCCVDL